MKILSSVLMMLLVLSCAYRGVYILLRLTGKKRVHPEGAKHRYAVLIAARNEEGVIGPLLDSIRKQDYPAELVDIYVVADNCTDRTAQTARAHGARAFERRDPCRVGKGCALQFLMERIQAERPVDSYDGYFIFDADNLLHPHYITAMDDVFSEGWPAVLGYRAAKNFSDTWMTGAYGIYFMCESECANRPRDLLGTSCLLSGTGCLLSGKWLAKHGGWAWTGYTEDLECTVDLLIEGERVAYCPDAILYDEQPRTFSESIVQRTRWVRGYMAAVGTHAKALFSRMFEKRGFAVFDFMMNLTPGILLGACVLVRFAQLAAAIITHTGVAGQIVRTFAGAAWVFIVFYIPGFVTLLLEWKRIRASAAKKLMYSFGFPVFMCSYLIVIAAAIFTEPDWKPICHECSMDIEDMLKEQG